MKIRNPQVELYLDRTWMKEEILNLQHEEQEKINQLSVPAESARRLIEQEGGNLTNNAVVRVFSKRKRTRIYQSENSAVV